MTEGVAISSAHPAFLLQSRLVDAALPAGSYHILLCDFIMAVLYYLYCGKGVHCFIQEKGKPGRLHPGLPLNS